MSTPETRNTPDQPSPRRIVIRRAASAPPASLPESPLTPPPQTATGGRRINWWAVGCFFLVFVCLVIVAVPVLLGVDLLTKVRDGVAYVIEGIRNGFQTQPVARVDSAQTVVNSIQPLGQLVSVEMQLAKADLRVDIRQGVLDACSYSASYVAVGVITAGVDLTQVGDADISYNTFTDTYTITLPPPQLTYCDAKDVNQYGESLTLCNVDWDSARQLGEYVALNEFRDDALEAGILERARQQSRLVLGSFVRSLTGSNVQIEFREESLSPPHASCQPSPPDGWTHDPARNAWVKP